MGVVLLGFFLDILILCCLGAVIYYAMRLSRSLNNFKSHKSEMDALISKLTMNITQAQQAIDGLKSTGGAAGKELQGLIDESRMLFDELQIMNQAGNSLAERLENLAGQAKPSDKGNLSLSSIVELSGEGKHASVEVAELPFSIQDRDFEESAASPLSDDNWSDGEQDLGIPDELQSQAERELFRALQKKQKQKPANHRH